MNPDDDKSFISKLSPAGAEIFRDPMSGFTRKRQYQLLAISTISILLSLAIVTPIEGELAGIKVNIDTPSAILQVAGWVTVYFWTVYVISVLQDVKIFRLQQLVPWSSVVELFNNTFNAAIDALDPDNYEKETTLTTQKYLARINELSSRTIGIHDKPDLRNLQQVEEYFQEEKRKKDAYQKGVDELRQELKKELERSASKWQSAFAKQMERGRMLAKIQADYSRLSKLRYLVEILFPLIFGLVAIWMSLVPEEISKSATEFVNKIVLFVWYLFYRG